MQGVNLMKKQDIVLTDELVDVLGDEFEAKKKKEPEFAMNFIQWVEFRLWEMAHQSHAF